MGRVCKFKLDSAVFLATAAATILIMLPRAGLAQPAERAAVVSGQIVGVGTGAELQVELRGSGSRSGTLSAYVSLSGDFQFYDVEVGTYELLVTDFRGHVVHREYTSVGQSQDLRIWLSEKPRVLAPGGTVSMAQLGRKLPRKAVNEYRAGVESAQKGEMPKAIVHLEKALVLAPDYMEARNELGVCKMKEQRFEEAVEEFRMASNLDPGAVAPLSNLAAVLFVLQRSSEAEAAARQALKLEPARSKTRYLLGMILHSEKQFTKETLALLKSVADEFPEARLAMADVLAQLGRKEEAILEAKQYLSQPGGKRDRSEVELWLAGLSEATQ